ncbi:thioester domain-containing protein [Clostridium chromiireducens]|uniref:thioester domain-containing protein n=1 Tax=Clostridium chromiireducens TaxID=225345 RepID=UPI003AF89921
MKLSKFIRVSTIFMICMVLLSNIIGATMPEKIKIITEKEAINTVQYDGNNISVHRLRIEGSNNVTYCLEINRHYPSGHSFTMSTDMNEKLNNILAAGYPNKSARELNLDNDNQAYFATQIAIWSLFQGYDVNAIKSQNTKIIEAIKKIYAGGVAAKYNSIFQSRIYKTSDESVQDVVVISYDDLTIEEQVESMESEYPPQEG